MHCALLVVPISALVCFSSSQFFVAVSIHQAIRLGWANTNRILWSDGSMCWAETVNSIGRTNAMFYLRWPFVSYCPPFSWNFSAFCDCPVHERVFWSWSVNWPQLVLFPSWWWKADDLSASKWNSTMYVFGHTCSRKKQHKRFKNTHYHRCNQITYTIRFYVFIKPKPCVLFRRIRFNSTPDDC